MHPPCFSVGEAQTDCRPAPAAGQSYALSVESDLVSKGRVQTSSRLTGMATCQKPAVISLIILFCA
jgi:hypothetical protein